MKNISQYDFQLCLHLQKKLKSISHPYQIFLLCLHLQKVNTLPNQTFENMNGFYVCLKSNKLFQSSQIAFSIKSYRYTNSSVNFSFLNHLEFVFVCLFVFPLFHQEVFFFTKL